MSPTADMMRIITPIVVLTSHMLRRLKCVRTALTKNVMRNHQSIAPPNINRYPMSDTKRGMSCWMKLNRVNKPIVRNRMSGLEKQNKKPVMVSCV